MTTQSLFTPEQGAAKIQVGRTRFYALMKSGDIRSVKIGKLRRIPARALEEYVERLERESAELAGSTASTALNGAPGAA